LGDGEYYSTLAGLYSWYYNPGSWDKRAVLDIISTLGPAKILEVGCGDGWLLDKLRERKLNAYGVEINEKAVKDCRERGLKVFLPGEKGLEVGRNCILCLLQTIEHVPNPYEFAAALVQQYQPQHIILTAPCFESMLGYTSDPLSWPPHHATAWSHKGFETLAHLLGYSVSFVGYSPLSYGQLNNYFEGEGTRKMQNIPYIPTGRLGYFVLKMYQGLGKSWACRGHSILVVLTQKDKGELM
jgi:SAM-dependent methyltransferase